MEKIVKTGMKIDLHIHSSKSVHKDGKKVRYNTISNIGILIDKLNQQCVNICSITDHDVFSYEMYQALKKAEKEDNSIKKVLPGIEFSVNFKDDNSNEKTVHVICIFDDADDNKIKELETIINLERPNSNGAYSEEKFLDLLRKIDINTILIAHQKNTLSSKNAKKNDVQSLGENKFLEFVYSDYFEAFEFKNKRNEILNKNYLLQNNIEKKVSFVTGTDCHDWKVYPHEDKFDKTENFPYTFAKCLPTFRGLVMAMTDNLRLKRVNSFFNVDKVALDYINVISNGQKMQIPLSRGINVIIGDNSVGKSMLLHALTGYSKISTNKVLIKGYKKYLKNSNLEIPVQLNDDDIFYFDMQGEVRKKFEENILNTTEFLKPNFPKCIDSAPYKAILKNEVNRLIEYLSKKFLLQETTKKLNGFNIVVTDGPSQSLTFIKNLRKLKNDTNSINSIITKFSELIILIDETLKLTLDEEDKLYLKEQKNKIEVLYNKYKNKLSDINNENERIELVAQTIDKIARRHSKSITDYQKRESAFSDTTSSLKDNLISIIKSEKNIETYTPNIPTINIKANSNRIHDYEFVSKFRIDEINIDYFNECINKVFKAHKKYNWEDIDEKKLNNLLLRFDNNEPILEFFKRVLNDQIDKDFEPKYSIISKGMDKSTELSSGFNSKIYFDLLSYETTRNGVYIIDQPEDNVSQPAIKSYLLEYFKNMGENRQVILVTHNPQFIVNLDVDNLIFMSKQNNYIVIKSGALEYENEDYSILDIVATNVDGGLDSIRKRWKRYEKASSI